MMQCERDGLMAANMATPGEDRFVAEKGRYEEYRFSLDQQHISEQGTPSLSPLDDEILGKGFS